VRWRAAVVRERAARLAEAQFALWFERTPRLCNDHDAATLTRWEEEFDELIAGGTYEPVMVAAWLRGQARHVGFDDDGTFLIVWSPERSSPEVPGTNDPAT